MSVSCKSDRMFCFYLFQDGKLSIWGGDRPPIWTTITLHMCFILISAKVSTANSGHLSGAERRKNHLILTLLLGKRDLLQSFLSIYVHSINDFNWEKLLKYVWSLETGTVQVIGRRRKKLHSCDAEYSVFLRLNSASASLTMDMSSWV